MTYLVDSHCHLINLAAGENPLAPAQILARAGRCGVTHFLHVTSSLTEYHAARELFAPFPQVFFGAAVHPLDLKDNADWTETELRRCLREPRTIAVGETGLDYHYEPDTRARQRASFARQIAVAREMRKPLSVHAREAGGDLVALLRSESAADCGGVIHCFTDSREVAGQCLDLGFYLSVTGIVTFKSAAALRDLVRYVPADRLLLETDCPYLAPIPVRGHRNEPAFVRHTLRFLAALSGCNETELARRTAENFARLFKITLQTCPVPALSGAPTLLDGLLDRPL